MARNVVLSFLTRGDLLDMWETDLQHFLKYLLDADWFTWLELDVVGSRFQTTFRLLG